MKIVFLVGATSTKVGDKKPTKFYGGETEDIVDKEARYLLDEGFAARPGTKKAKAFLATMEDNPRTRRINLNATTPGLASKIANRKLEKRALQELGKRLNDEDDTEDNGAPRDDEGGLRGRGRRDKGKDKAENNEDEGGDEDGAGKKD